MSATKGQASQRVAKPVGRERLNRSVSRLRAELNDPGHESLGVELPAFVAEFRSAPDRDAELHRRAFLVPELCAQQSPYQQERLNVAKQFAKTGTRVGTLEELLSDAPFTASPEFPHDLEKIVHKLGIVIDADSDRDRRDARLPASVIDACWAWRGACRKVLKQCREVQAEGCCWLWKAAEEQPDDQPTVAKLLAPQFGEKPRQAVLDALDSLLDAVDGEPGQAVATKKSKGGRPVRWAEFNRFYEQETAKAKAEGSKMTMRMAADRFIKGREEEFDSPEEMVNGLKQFRKPKKLR